MATFILESHDMYHLLGKQFRGVNIHSACLRQEIELSL